MTKSKEEFEPRQSSELTSAGVPWSEVGDDFIHYVEWMDGRHGPAPDVLPTVDDLPVPPIFHQIPHLHPDRPRGATPMLDVSGARARLSKCRPGAWLISPFTGWRWAKWPNGEIGWLPSNVSLPTSLRVWPRNDLQ